MKKKLALLIASFLVCSLSTSVFASPIVNNTSKVIQDKYVKDEILVKFNTTSKQEDKLNTHKKLGSSILKQFNGLRIDYVKLKIGVTVEQAIEQYKKNPNVEYAAPNYIHYPHATPNDTSFKQLWGLHNTGQYASGDFTAGYGTLDADIDAPEAWDITKGSNDVVVAVVDSGVDYKHSDLAANMWVNPGEIAGNGLDDDNNGYIDDIHGINAYSGTGDPMDEYGHGTHVAGTIGAVGNNRKGVTGINWNVKIMALKWHNPYGGGSTADIIECLEYARAMKAKGIKIVATQNSWGGYNYEQPLTDAIQAQQDILFVASAGNDGEDNDGPGHVYPANYELPNIISVVATDYNDNRPYFTNYGKKTMHIGAPGTNILSTFIGGKYESWSGTSMSAPHVTGVAALLKAQDPNRSAQAIKNLILTGGDTIPSMDGYTISGKRLNAYGSLTKTTGSVLAALQYPEYPTVGSTFTISVLSIKGANAVGPVTATSNTGNTAILNDDGISPDLFANDGVFSASWTAQEGESALTLNSPAGTKQIYLSPLVINSINFAYSTINKPYSFVLTAKGGTQPITWSLIAGKLPDGLSLNASTGEISGVPTALGKFDFTIQAKDNIQTATHTMTIEIGESEFWSYDSGKDDRANSVACDTYGNIYIASTSKNGTNNDLQLIKYSPAGEIQWAKTYDGGNDDNAKGVVVDSEGFAYIMGTSFKSSIGDICLTVKYDASGNMIWSKEIINQRPEDMCIDKNDMIYIGGHYSSSAFVVKFDKDGTILLNKIVSASCSAITVDDSGYIYLTNGNMVTGINKTTKCDASGNVIWSSPYTTPDGAIYGIGTFLAKDIAVDNNGNVYVTGDYGIDDGNSARDILVVKYNSLGAVQWSKTYSYDGTYESNGIAIDPLGNPLVTASNHTQDYSFTLKYDPAGSIVSNQKYEMADDEITKDITIDKLGNIYTVGDKKNSSDANYNIFVIKQASSIVNSITITKAEYVTRTQLLTVYATSSYGANAALQLEGYGPMTWNAKNNRWEKVVSGITTPFTVTVSGPEGSKTADVSAR